MQSSRISRRNFLRSAISTAAGAAAVSPLVVSSSVLGRDGSVPPNEKIVCAFIGIGSRAQQVMGDFMNSRNKPFQIVAVCDCFTKPLEEGRLRVNQFNDNNDCKTYARYEDILARPDLDSVTITTPDHWHTKITVEACRAGKDVFCEKPLTLTPLETRQIVAAARKYNRVCTSGSQRVMEDYGYMAPVVKSGALGEVKEAYLNVGGPPYDLYYPEEQVPEGDNWDRWLGPAPWVPFHPERCSGSYGGGWRRCWDYGNGFLADWGAHKLGGILYVLGLDADEPIEILPPKCEKNPKEWLCWVYPNGTKIYHAMGGPHDITLIGTEREYRHQVDRNKIKPLGPTDLRRYAPGANRLAEDFAYCVHNRTRPFQDFVYGGATALGCQLANITYKLNRPLKWNAATTSFDDEIANRFVNRPKRSPYVIEEI
ncbi:MAG: Gfo/Idh/MocA family oxidoreductase [Planctomycetaceae bacterium]|jgi:hypothetical protein|nr:Gfo/Idh/MocA family oxidoreductase [Planctomycetaceae bacterium]